MGQITHSFLLLRRLNKIKIMVRKVNVKLESFLKGCDVLLCSSPFSSGRSMTFEIPPFAYHNRTVKGLNKYCCARIYRFVKKH